MMRRFALQGGRSGKAHPHPGGPRPGGSHLSGRVGRASTWGLVFVLAVSAGLNVALARRVRQLGDALTSQVLHHTPLPVGAVVPPIAATGLDGRSATVAYAGSDRLTVLYVFTPQCGWCARNLDNFTTLLKARSQEARFVGLSLSPDSVAEYVRAHELTLPVLTRLSAATMTAYRFGGTPQTMVISPQGRVIKNWPGAWTTKTQAEIEAFFHVRLPGLKLPAAEVPPSQAPQHL